MAEPADLSGGAPRPALLIVHVGPPEPADAAEALYRTVQPCRALGELPEVAVISGSLFSPELYRPAAGAPAGTDLLAAADVLVLRDVADPDLLPVVAARRREGRLTVFEPGPRLMPAASAEALADLAARSLAPQLARLADGVQVSGFGLEAQLDALNPRRARFPSHLWEVPGGEPRAHEGSGLVIGWIGGAADREDLAIAIPALAGILDRHPEARVAVQGGREIGEALATLPADRVRLVPSGTMVDAQRFLTEIDIGLLPLAPPPRDRFASDIRALEYAAQGVLVIAADAEPFREFVRGGQTGLLFRDPGELETVLERALGEPDLRATIIARARTAAAERVERPHAAQRLGFYLSLAAQRGIRWASRAGQAAAALLEAAGPAPRFPGSQYAALGSGEVERLLVEGTRRRTTGDRAEAARAFAEAERLAPDSHLPPLLLAGVLPDPTRAVDALARAEARRPGSCRAAYERGLGGGGGGGQEGVGGAVE
jgi:hypothetical protein